MGRPKLTNNRANQKLDEQNRQHIRCIGNPQGYTKKVDWECHNCMHIWRSTPHVVLTQTHGCPNCAKMTNESIDLIMHDLPIKRIGNFIYANTPILWECNACHHKWNTRPTKIINKRTNCPKCSGKAPLTNAEVDSRLINIGNNITRIGDIVNISTKMKWRCNNDHVWMATPQALLINKTGCPHCYAKHGGRGTPTTVNKICFRSKLEAKMYEDLLEYTRKYGLTLELQKRYKSTSKHTCDFYIPELTMWIEVSNYTSDDYITNINKKRNWIKDIDQTFYFVENFKELLTLID